MRYVATGAGRLTGWTHLFIEDDPKTGQRVPRERVTRFVYDLDAGRLIFLEIERDGRFCRASGDDMVDLEDSLAEANSGALDNPEAYGLVASEELPAWCTAPLDGPLAGLEKDQPPAELEDASDLIDFIAAAAAHHGKTSFAFRLRDVSGVELSRARVVPELLSDGSIALNIELAAAE